MDGLTIQKVITDYLKYFAELALKRLQVHEKLIHDMHFKEFVSEKFIDEDIKAVCYCLVCPTDRQAFMKDCFIKAGIIEESEAERRLLFSTRAVATAHCQLSLKRNVTKIQSDYNYLVCDVDDVSIGIAKIQAASTESLSSVTAISDNLTLGSINLETKFEDYLMENMAKLNLNLSAIAQFVDAFSKHYKFNMDFPEYVVILQNDANGNRIKFTYEELNKIVFREFIDSITEYILNATKTHGQYNLFLSGKYGADAYLFENLRDKYEGEIDYCISFDESSLNTISFGAVSLILNTYVSQTSCLYGEQASTSENVLEGPTKDTNGNGVYDFIVGIDFGTSSSKCSYVQLKDKDRNPMPTRIIQTIKEDWTRGGFFQLKKTLTLLMYYINYKTKYWGEGATLQTNQHKDLNFLEILRLYLCPAFLEFFNGENFDLEEMMIRRGLADIETPKKGSKNEVFVVQAIADYLKLFKKHVVEYIITKEMNEKFNVFTREKLLKKYKIRYVITVPALWNASARNFMVQAAIEATIIKKDEIDQLLIISEPEAAVLYCEKRFPDYFKNWEGDINDTNFIICDAGETIVDSVTFNLTVQGKKEQVICQIGDAVGDSCGSKYLDVRFKDYICEFYRSCGVNLDNESVSLDDIMRDFVTNYKPNFMPDRNCDSYDIDLPGKGIINFRGNYKYRTANGDTTLRIKSQDIKEKIFSPIVARVISLINDQLRQAEKGGRTIDAILMVGGFSRSRYLQQQIKGYFKGWCRVIIPLEGVTAISHSAVSYALNPRMITKKTAGQSLGLLVLAPLEKDLANSHKRNVKDPDGEENLKKDRLEYFVTRGEELENVRPRVYKKDVYVVYPNTAAIEIFSCDSEENANSRYLTMHHTKILEAKIIMPSMVGIDGKLIHFTVSLQIDHFGVSVIIECQDQLINAEVQKITRNEKSSLKIYAQA
ncbi:hypothetical protein INT47_007906 [Mucor saturninus]|uniref:Heat shock protein 70 n=1 Tax=Mucor saturninus TaxID=64648 RepID=A0A8H7UY72_9FUNG|nr:hypothetical protein INT47_007906 [Mucor saturninus]